MAQIRDRGLALAGRELFQLLLLISVGAGLDQIAELAKEEEEAAAAESSARRAQVGSGDRSEKIRTYNYKDNRTTDHRLGKNFPLETVLNGQLSDLIEACTHADQQQKLEELAASEG